MQENKKVKQGTDSSDSSQFSLQMLSWRKNHNSCSSSCSSSPTGSPSSTPDNGILKVMNDRAQSFKETRRLTRQRKLRYATDDELGLRSLSRSTPASPESTPELRSRPRSSSVPHPLPMPLPLPEIVGPRVLCSSCGHGNLGSPIDGPSSSVGRPFVFGCGNPHSMHQTLPSIYIHTTRRVDKPSTLSRRGFRQDLNLDSDNLRPNLSAPSSPTISPPRLSRAPQGGWRAQERPCSPQPSCRSLNTTRSADHSPVHSPTSGRDRDNHNPRSPRSVSFPLGQKWSLSESPRTWYENNVNAHPLPLPPGHPLPSPQASAFKPNGNMPGSNMRGQWQKGKLIGRGTFGSVYAATNRETGALCAMKEVDLIPDDPKSIESLKQLEQEIRVLRQLKHPNIVQYYGSEITEDHFYIFLEYVYPGSINRYLREHCGAMTESVIRNFTRHILSGLAYLHSKNTIHRDIKGANLLVDATGVVKLADFGMAKHLTGQVSILSLKGSPYWMAPEVLQGTGTSDKNPDSAYAVDIWSVGCTIIEMLNGKPPWGDLEGPQAMFKVLHKSPPIPATLSAEGKDFLQRCFRRNPAERPSAVQLLQHPFLRNSHDQHLPFPSMKLMGWNSLA